MDVSRGNLQRAHDYVRAVAGIDTTYEEIAEFYGADAIWQEMPNTFVPAGRTGRLAEMRGSWENGRRYVSDQRYDVLDAVADGGVVALRLRWSGHVRETLGPIPGGTTLTAGLAIFLWFEDGRIVRQIDFPCYDPLPATER